MNDSMRRIVRTTLQLIAGGALSAVFLQVAKDVPDSYAPYLVMLSTGIVAVAQIAVEEMTGRDIGVGRTGK